MQRLSSCELSNTARTLLPWAEALLTGLHLQQHPKAFEALPSPLRPYCPSAAICSDYEARLPRWCVDDS